MSTLPKCNQGVYILDSLPRGSRGPAYIDIDVYYRDLVSGREWMVESEFGNVDRVPLMMGDDWHAEKHDVFDGYWWTDGNMGCDCNRGRDKCNTGPNEVIITKITPRGMPDVVLLSEEPGGLLTDRIG